MSEIKAGKLQSGISVTPANNFVLDPSADDGSCILKTEDGTEILQILDTRTVKFAGDHPAASDANIVLGKRGTAGGRMTYELSDDSTLSGAVNTDTNSVYFRIFENTGDNRGAGINLTECPNQAAGLLYHSGNILNSVSQVGGVPTGGIIERGSNANGEYTKFADGTLICANIIVGSATAEATWTFPASFSANPKGISQMVAYSAGGLLAAKTAAVGTASLTFSIYNTNNARQALSVRLTAIGRWF